MKKPHIDKDFILKQSKHIDKEDVEKLARKQKRLNKIMNLQVFWKQKQKIKILFELFKQYKSGRYKMIPWRSFAAITFSLLYIVNPLDIVPDVLPIVGYVDDISVFLTLYKLIEKDIEKYEDWKVGEDQKTATSEST